MKNNIYSHIKDLNSTAYCKLMKEAKNPIEFKTKELQLAEMIEKEMQGTIIREPHIYVDPGNSGSGFIRE